MWHATAWEALNNTGVNKEIANEREGENGERESEKERGK